MADAINNIADTASSVLTMIGFKLASKKPDKKHPYGYARYEYVAGFVIAILMLIMGLTFAKESIVKIFNPEELTINTVTYVILVIAILGKLLQMFVYIDFAKAIDSNTLKTNAIDTRNDIISTTAILISMIIMGIFNINIDGILGLAVSGLIIYSATGMIKEVLEPIIGIVPTEEQVEEISKKLLSYDITKFMAKKEYFAVYTENKWGVINSQGETVIEPSYAEMIIVPDSTKDVFLCI